MHADGPAPVDTAEFVRCRPRSRSPRPMAQTLGQVVDNNCHVLGGCVGSCMREKLHYDVHTERGKPDGRIGEAG